MELLLLLLHYCFFRHAINFHMAATKRICHRLLVACLVHWDSSKFSVNGQLEAKYREVLGHSLHQIWNKLGFACCSSRIYSTWKVVIPEIILCHIHNCRDLQAKKWWRGAAITARRLIKFLVLHSGWLAYKWFTNGGLISGGFKIGGQDDIIASVIFLLPCWLGFSQSKVGIKWP